MKRVVSDLVTRTHGENNLARRQKSSAVKVAVGEASVFSFFRSGIYRTQMRDEFLPDGICDRRSVTLELRQPGAQSAFTRCSDLVSDRVIVPQVQQAQERSKSESLERERPQHD